MKKKKYTLSSAIEEADAHMKGGLRLITLITIPLLGLLAFIDYVLEADGSIGFPSAVFWMVPVLVTTGVAAIDILANFRKTRISDEPWMAFFAMLMVATTGFITAVFCSTASEAVMPVGHYDVEVPVDNSLGAAREREQQELQALAEEIGSRHHAAITARVVNMVEEHNRGRFVGLRKWLDIITDINNVEADIENAKAGIGK